MILGNPWGLLALLGIPLVIFIHLFRRRFAPLPVSTLFLWDIPDITKHSGTRREKLRKSTSLFAEILALCAIAWYLSDPHLSQTQQARHILIVLDSRVSMQAEHQDGTSSREQIINALHQYCAGLTEHDRLTLISSGKQARLLNNTAEPAAKALAHLSTWRCNQAWHELSSAYDLAHKLVRENKQNEYLVCTDRIDRNKPDHFSALYRGEPTVHTGLTHISWPHSNSAIYLHGINSSDERKRTLLIQKKNGQIIARMPVFFPTHSRCSFQIPLDAIPKDCAEIHCRLDGPDPLTYDDSVSALRPEARTIRIAIDPTLRTLQAVEQGFACQDDVLLLDSVTEDTQAADIFIGDAPINEGTWNLRLQSGSADACIGPFLQRHGHPLVRDIDCTGVLWAGGQQGVNANSIIISGNSTLLRDVSSRQNKGQFELYCDLKRSTLSSHPAWPSLCSNIVSARRATLAGLHTHTLPCGEELFTHLPYGEQDITLIAPDGSRSQFRANALGEIHIDGLEQSGLWNIEIEGQAWRSFTTHHLDPRLSDVSNCITKDDLSAMQAVSTVERHRSPLEHLLPCLLAAVCAAAAWGAYSREQRS